MSSTYEVHSHTERLRNRVFSVVTDAVEMPGGEVVDRDYMVHIGAVGVVALDGEGRVALIRQYRPAVRQVLWELPAGLIDVPGEPLVDAAARELAEEADLVAARWDLLAEVHTTPGCSNEKIRLFLARELAPKPDGDAYERTHEEADLEVHWVALDDAVAMALSGEITNAACVIGVLAAAQARSRDWSSLRPAADAE
ncbi:NUDIX domain-containing protein [Dactylosporangium matsuzakiense]|uniref:NUDIX hydrolase n=1 Tax=Dactylosporangium matsuzakiense TaxID=53360 RepID=A0A9W6NPC7_9ACTN|nr:NUDIX hydrolase [Dactylosporangium matsuzakiense]UWZ42924.1 NUDIX hydrolase [Dactylosporangium matsuzakiense]GLL03942.1 NUDIX hydrolase [Dactylosporangium matsuzakiense]